ncbi:hypothetical protein [uncultured Novosphingobium sp.]|uniref:hypothetical protein n=1 Tax=uncultured Novosphingobium sp. TaxID=292277 RepID=UPI002599F0A2|nr:hypothetical protein [uncultured Novosphingobium sp.]
MEIVITKGLASDHIAIRRASGEAIETTFPKKGPVPHDAVHFFVEQGLGFARGFWGLVAEGRHPEELAELAKVGGHASAARAREPDAQIVQLLQAERLVECFEADLWSGGCDDEALWAMARTACESSFVPLPPSLQTMAQRDALGRVRDAIAAFACDWFDGGEGFVARLDWPEAA